MNTAKKTNYDHYNSSLFLYLTAVIATFFSGAAGLSYEIIWTKMLVVPFGNSADATTIVLSAFMIGIAAGSKITGSLSDKIISPIKIYVIAEILLSIYAVSVPFISHSLEARQLFSGNSDNLFLTNLFRFATAGSIVAIPAILMGAAVPVLVKSLSFTIRDTRLKIGILYGANTIGGAAGAAVTGFIAIPAAGLIESSLIAASFSIFAALIIFAASKISNFSKTSLQVKAEVVKNYDNLKWIPFIAAAASGVAILGLEVVWNRILTFVFGHDTYAFSILLIIVLTGLGAGGAFHRLLVKYDQKVVSGLSILLMALFSVLSFFTAAQIIISLGMDPFEITLNSSLSTSLWKEFIRELLYAPILVFLPTFAAGVSLPSAVSLYTNSVSKTGSNIGTIFLINGIAAAASTILTGALLIPFAGIQNSVIIISITSAVAALIILFSPFNKVSIFNYKAYAYLFLTLVIIIISFAMGGNLPKKMLHEAVGANHQKLLYYKEGRTGTVSVTKNVINQERQLFINSVNEVTTRIVHDQSFKLLGQLGPLLHPNPKTGFTICFGAGISAGAAMSHPLETMDIVDLSSIVWNAAPYFKNENNNVLMDKRVVKHIEDGRQYLLKSQEHYDVMVLDSTHPKAVDSWILYTTGFYKIAKAHLNEDGILVQWLPLHGLSVNEFKIIINTFLKIFPHMTVWANVGFETYGKAAYVKLVGTNKPLQIDFTELSRRLKEPRIKNNLKSFGMDSPYEILDSFLADSKTVKNWIGNLPVQTDNRPFVSYITKYSQGERMDAANLIPLRSSVIPFVYNIGKNRQEFINRLYTANESNGFLMAGQLDNATRLRPDGKKIALFNKRFHGAKNYYLKLARLYNKNPMHLFWAANMLANNGFTIEALKIYKQVIKLWPNKSAIKINMALALMDMGQLNEAHDIVAKLLDDEPDNSLANYNFGTILLRLNNPGQAMGYLSKAILIDNNLLDAKCLLADTYRQMGQLDKSISLLQTLTEQNPQYSDAFNSLGLAYLQKKETRQAIINIQKALLINPFNFDYHYNMGVALEKEDRYVEAAGAYNAAITINPKDAEARNNLGLLYGKSGQYDKAVEQHLLALEIEPQYPEAAFNLGLDYEAIGNSMAAAEAFTIALKLNPNLDNARKKLKKLGIEKAEIDLQDDSSTE
ncbi:MAG: tetratricopeptide repeat protein [Deltaproteobacteria bacterium]|nr:tetratricopeptide repeat protein [Deltaproteobacteria bacterium]